MNIGFLEIGFWDALDILIFGYLLFLLYRLLKGAVAFYILLAVLLLYSLGWIFKLLEMNLMNSLFEQVSSIGLILLVIVFQPEIRQFLIMLGTSAIKSRHSFIRKLLRINLFEANTNVHDETLEEIKLAILSMSASKTGALIILAQEEQLNTLRSTGVRLDARISQLIIESIFEKNSPMHDGAMIILKNRIYAASAILPLSYDANLPLKYGLRHRAAIGASEASDIHALVISEESGTLSYVYRGKIEEIKSEVRLVEILNKYRFS